ncbi:MAG: HAD family hydrolase, partial [Candidatus Rokubacteria bacterium]|nr:HAD family hydrolase [Candidatus Rokubacteria bacterium]
MFFDFGGTLDANGIPWKERFFGLYRDHGVAVPAAEFALAFYAADAALVGTIPRTLALRDTVFTLSAAVARALGRDAAVGERVAQRFLDDAGVAFAESAGVLARLAPRFRLGVVSNFYGNLERVCADAGLDRWLAVMVDSACVGCEKPDARIFRHATDALGLAPAAVTFVGDSLPRDMAGARALGMP